MSEKMPKHTAGGILEKMDERSEIIPLLTIEEKFQAIVEAMLEEQTDEKIEQLGEQLELNENDVDRIRENIINPDDHSQYPPPNVRFWEEYRRKKNYHAV